MSTARTSAKSDAALLPSTESVTSPSNRSRKRILILCPYPVGVAAGQRLKYEQYIEHWRSSGYDVDIAPFMDMAMWRILYVSGHTLTKAVGTFKGYLRRYRDLFRIRSYDGIYIFMWITPLGTSMFERLAVRLGRKIIYDVEDNIFVETGNELNRFAKLLKSPQKTTVLVRNADHVITSSPVLNEYCEQINAARCCTFVTSSVDACRYIAGKREGNNGPVVIGWTGTFTSKRFLDLLRPVLLKLKEARDFKLLVIGNFDYDFPEINCEVVRWKKETEIEDLQRIDIGVYPLPQEDWVLGKSGLKVIQYMAMSLPTVSTNYGTAQEIISHGDNGFLASTEDEWVKQLVQLIDNGELRHKLGTAARKTVEERYSTEVVKEQYRQVLSQAFG